MCELYRNFKEKIEFVDKFLLILIIAVPFLLATSIFLADLACSISGIILIYIFFKKKIIFFRIIKTEIILMVVFQTVQFIIHHYQHHKFKLFIIAEHLKRLYLFLQYLGGN